MRAWATRVPCVCLGTCFPRSCPVIFVSWFRFSFGLCGVCRCCVCALVLPSRPGCVRMPAWGLHGAFRLTSPPVPTPPPVPPPLLFPPPPVPPPLSLPAIRSIPAPGNIYCLGSYRDSSTDEGNNDDLLAASYQAREFGWTSAGGHYQLGPHLATEPGGIAA